MKLKLLVLNVSNPRLYRRPLERLLHRELYKTLNWILIRIFLYEKENDLRFSFLDSWCHCTYLQVSRTDKFRCIQLVLRTMQLTSKMIFMNCVVLKIMRILTFPRGGWTSKKNVRFMYQLPIFPKCVSSQQTWSGSFTL